MQKFKTLFFNRINALTATISLLLFSLLMLAITLSPATVYSSEKDVTRFSPDIIQGVTCSFDITCESENLETISLKFGTYGRNNNGALSVVLFDTTGASIEEWTYDCRQIKDLVYVDFNLTNPIKDSKGNSYHVIVTSNSDEGMGVCLACNDEVLNLDFENSNFIISPCYTLGFKSTISSLISSYSKTSLILGVIELVILAIVIPFSVYFVLAEYTHGKLLLILLPYYLLVFSTHRILEHSDTSIVAHRIFLVLAYVLLTILWIVTTIITYNLIVKKDTPLHVVAVVVLSLLSIVSILFNTPATIPDGDYHYGFAYHYSNCILGYSTPFKDDYDAEGNRIIYMRDADAELILAETRTNSHVLGEDSYIVAVNTFINQEKNYEVHPYLVRDYLRTDMTFVNNNAILSHIIPAIGITIGRLLSLDALTTFYLGRLCNAIFFTIMAYFSIKIIPIGKNLLFTVFTIPMTIFLSASLSYDGFVISICILFTAMLVRILYQPEKMTIRQLIALALVSIVIIPSKFVYTPLIISCFAIPAEKIPVKHPVAFKRILFGIMVLGCIAASFIPRIIGMFLVYVEPLLMRIGNGSYIGLVTGSFEIATVTFFEKTEEILESMIFHAGWGQFYLPAFMYAIYYGIIIISASNINNDICFLKKKDKILLSSIMIIITILLALPLIMYKSPDGGDVIIGLNGRYFLCILPLLMLTFRPKLHFSETVLKKANVLSVYMCFACWIYTLLKLFGTLNG